MNKNWLIAIPVLLLSISSCKEKGPIIDMGGKEIADTFYVGAVVAPQAHNVLVEEFTGATCTNCPAARDQLKEISDANDHRLIVVAIHPNGVGQAKPVHDAKYDFRTEKGTSIKDIYYNDLQGIPAAGFDRVKVDGGSALLRTKWPAAIQARLDMGTPVNLELASKFDAASNKATIDVKVIYTQAMTDTPKITLALIEDSLIDKQEIGGQEIVENYVFMHVFRDFLTAVNGDAFMTSKPQKEAGLVFIRQYKNIEINPDWKAKNCHIVAFVHYDNGDDREVLQVAETHLVE